MGVIPENLRDLSSGKRIGISFFEAWFALIFQQSDYAFSKLLDYFMEVFL